MMNYHTVVGMAFATSVVTASSCFAQFDPSLIIERRPITKIAVSPDCKLLAYGNHEHDALTLVNMATGRIENVKLRGNLSSLVFSKKSDYILAGLYSKGFQKVSTREDKQSLYFRMPGDVRTVACVDNGFYVTTVGRSIAIWSNGDEFSNSIDQHDELVLAACADAGKLASSSRAGEIFITDMKEMTSKKLIMEEPRQALSCLLFCGNGKFLAVGDVGGRVSIFQMSDLKRLYESPRLGLAVTSIAFHDGHLFVASISEKVSVIRVETRKLSFLKTEDIVSCVCVLEKEKRMIAGSGALLSGVSSPSDKRYRLFSWSLD